MKTELDIYVKIYQEYGYTFTAWGNDLPNPLRFTMDSILAARNKLPDTIDVHYDDVSGDVLRKYHFIHHLINTTEMNVKIKIELRDNTLEKILEE